jgi:MraZ protein
MFRSEYYHSLDDKGRIIIPARFRAELGGNFFATRGAENCVYLYPCAEWEKIETQLSELPTSKYDERAFVRSIISGVAECEMTAQGRVLLPATLRDHAFLTKDVAVVGALRHVEIWDAPRWKAYNEELHNGGRFEEVAARLSIGL